MRRRLLVRLFCWERKYSAEATTSSIELCNLLAQAKSFKCFQYLSIRFSLDNKEAAKLPKDDVQTSSRQPGQPHFYGTKHCPWLKRSVPWDSSPQVDIRWIPGKTGCSSKRWLSRKSCRYSMNRRLEYGDVSWSRVARLKRSSAVLASSNRHVREGPDPSLLRPQRGVRNGLGSCFFHLFQQFFRLLLGFLILQMAQIMLRTTVTIALLFQ